MQQHQQLMHNAAAMAYNQQGGIGGQGGGGTNPTNGGINPTNGNGGGGGINMMGIGGGGVGIGGGAGLGMNLMNDGRPPPPPHTSLLHMAGMVARDLVFLCVFVIVMHGDVAVVACPIADAQDEWSLFVFILPGQRLLD